MKPSQQVRELAATVPGATTDELLHNLLANLAGLLGARRAYVTEVANGTWRLSIRDRLRVSFLMPSVLTSICMLVLRLCLCGCDACAAR